MITTWEELKSSIADELSRSDLTSVIPEWIQLAESWCAREIRLIEGEQMVSANFVADQAWIDMPAGFRAPMHIEIQENPLRILEIVSLEKRSDVLQNDVATTPRAIAFVGNKGFLAPAPGGTSEYHLYYYGTPPPLNAGNPSNTLLVDAPDLLKYASLCYSAPYLGDDERLAIWMAMRNEAKASLKKEYWNRHADGGKLRIRPERVPRDAHR